MKGMDPEPIAAGGIADGASDVQKGGKLLFGGINEDDEDADMNGCQQHKLKSLYESVERRCAPFRADIEQLGKLFVSVSNSANVNNYLRSVQWVGELSDIALALPNDTRWEGHDLMLKCALRLCESLVSLREFASSNDIGSEVIDF